MEKLRKYKEILRNEMAREASYGKRDGYERKLIVNKEETEFIVLTLGWSNRLHSHGVTFHLGIKDEKVWLYCNNTDVEIGEVLAEKGIPKSDIVIAFVPEYERDLAYAGAQ